LKANLDKNPKLVLLLMSRPSMKDLSPPMVHNF
jgi:hypothetical protein